MARGKIAPLRANVKVRIQWSGARTEDSGVSRQGSAKKAILNVKMLLNEEKDVEIAHEEVLPRL